MFARNLAPLDVGKSRIQEGRERSKADWVDATATHDTYGGEVVNEIASRSR